MNILVAYDSKFGNTEKVAQAIKMALDDYGSVRLLPIERVDPFSLVNTSDVDLLIIGGPTQLHRISPEMRAFLDTIPRSSLRGLPAVCFDTRYLSPRWVTGSAARHIAHLLTEKGSHVVVQPESFFVVNEEGPLRAGELDRAAAWAQAVASKITIPIL